MSREVPQDDETMTVVGCLTCPCGFKRGGNAESFASEHEAEDIQVERLGLIKKVEQKHSLRRLACHLYCRGFLCHLTDCRLDEEVMQIEDISETDTETWYNIVISSPRHRIQYLPPPPT
jgi:hypothetical protein